MSAALTYRQSDYNFSDLFPLGEDDVTVSRSPSAAIRPTMVIPVFHNMAAESTLLEFLHQGRQTQRLPKPLIKIRAEKIDEKTTCKTAFENRRCIVATEVWYKWVDAGKPKKQRAFFEFPDSRVFYLAAIEVSGYQKRPKQDKWQQTQAVIIVTTGASTAVSDSGHHRQPALLDTANAKLWLDRRY